LKIELARAGAVSLGQNTFSLIDLDRPALDWAGIARGFGVPAVSVSTAEELARQFRQALSEPGPHLIEMMIGSRLNH
jgi:acetolactate synthase-1/2/3 large subunit